MKEVIIAMVAVMAAAGNAQAITAAEGQAAFDAVFWSIMTVWALGLSFGLAIKIINRS